MANSPVAGWYEDPGESTRLRYWDGSTWTDQVRAMSLTLEPEKPRRRLSGLAIGGIVVCSLLTIAGFTAIILASTGHSSSTGETPATGQTTPAVVAPAGWDVYTSRSGAIEYAVDPSWINTQTPAQEQMALAAMQDTDARMELAGVWVTDGSAVSGETNITVMAVSDGTPVPGALGLQANIFARSQSKAFGTGEPEIVSSENYSMPNGYDAWRIDYTLDMFGESINMSAILFRHEVTMGFIYAVSLKDFDEWIPDLLAIADSLVVVKPPTSP